MTRRVYLLAAANEELEEQHAWYALNAGPRTAQRFLYELRTTFRRLAASPGRGRFLLTARPELIGLRYWLIRGFPMIVYFRAVDDGIEILHVLHAARDRRGVVE